MFVPVTLSEEMARSIQEDYLKEAEIARLARIAKLAPTDSMPSASRFAALRSLFTGRRRQNVAYKVATQR